MAVSSAPQQQRQGSAAAHPSKLRFYRQHGEMERGARRGESLPPRGPLPFSPGAPASPSAGLRLSAAAVGGEPDAIGACATRAIVWRGSCRYEASRLRKQGLSYTQTTERSVLYGEWQKDRDDMFSASQRGGRRGAGACGPHSILHCTTRCQSSCRPC